MFLVFFLGFWTWFSSFSFKGEGLLWVHTCPKYFICVNQWFSPVYSHLLFLPVFPCLCGFPLYYPIESFSCVFCLRMLSGHMGCTPFCRRQFFLYSLKKYIRLSKIYGEWDISCVDYLSAYIGEWYLLCSLLITYLVGFPSLTVLV